MTPADLARLRTAFASRADSIIQSQQPPRAKLADFDHLFAESGLFGPSGDEWITQANDFTGAIYRFRADTAERMEKIIAEGMADGTIHSTSSSKATAQLLVALLDQALRTGRRDELEAAVNELLRS